MFAVPSVTPVTEPVEPSTVATELLSLDHTPPASPVEANVEEAVPQTLAVPVIVPAIGAGLTVNANVFESAPQVLLTTYLIVAAPAVPAVALPVASIESTELLSLDHVPPVVPVALTVVVLPPHNVVPAVELNVPAVGAEVTVKLTDTESAPQVLVTLY